MYKIGVFSDLTGLTIKTLRYYDQIGLLKPSKDNFTNYRYYDEKDIETYKKIVYLKSLGFTLEEIKNNIDNISIELLDSKINELTAKRDYLETQIVGLNNLRKEIKVKTLK